MSPDAQPGPIAGATNDLVAWLGDVAGSPVRLGMPVDGTDAAPALVALPLELRPDQEARGNGQQLPMRFVLRHLVCADGGIEEASRLLDRVLLAAATAPDRALVFDPPAPQTWLAFGVKPRPAVLFDIPVQIARPVPVTPLVRRPLQVRATPLVSLRGRVVGPDDVPLTNMRVEVAGTGRSTQTDSRGRFVLAGVPAGEPARLRLRGRGRYLLAEVETPQAEPVVIHCNIEEA
jgi:hypothetical protein